MQISICRFAASAGMWQGQPTPSPLTGGYQPASLCYAIQDTHFCPVEPKSPAVAFKSWGTTHLQQPWPKGDSGRPFHQAAHSSWPGCYPGLNGGRGGESLPFIYFLQSILNSDNFQFGKPKWNQFHKAGREFFQSFHTRHFLNLSLHNSNNTPWTPTAFVSLNMRNPPHHTRHALLLLVFSLAPPGRSTRSRPAASSTFQS